MGAGMRPTWVDLCGWLILMVIAVGIYRLHRQGVVHQEKEDYRRAKRAEAIRGKSKSRRGA